MEQVNQSNNFFNLISKYIRHINQNVREISLKIFIELAHLYYDNFENYIGNIFNFSAQIINNDVENNKILCMKIWATLGIEEDSRLNENNRKQSLGFLQKYYDELSELCLKFIVTDDYDNEEHNVSLESYHLISIMSRVCNNNFLDKMLDYISESINNPNHSEKIK